MSSNEIAKVAGDLTLDRFTQSALARPGAIVNPKMVSVVIAGIHAGSKSYGKPASGALLQSWTLALMRIEANAEELAEASAHFLVNSVEFPAIAEICQFILKRRDRAALDREAAANREARERHEAEATERHERKIEEIAKERKISIEKAREQYMEITRERIKSLMAEESPMAISKFGGKAVSPGEIIISEKEKADRLKEFRSQLAKEA